MLELHCYAVPDELPEDAIVGGMLDELVARWGAEPIRIPGVGHVPMLERRWRTVAGTIARWLDRIG